VLELGPSFRAKARVRVSIREHESTLAPSIQYTDVATNIKFCSINVSKNYYLKKTAVCKTTVLNRGYGNLANYTVLDVTVTNRCQYVRSSQPVSFYQHPFTHQTLGTSERVKMQTLRFARVINVPALVLNN